MSLLKILIYPENILKQKVLPVAKITDDIRRLVNDMAETMYEAPGVGLAANQVGVNKQIAIVDISHDELESELFVLINPEIIESSGTIEWEEGCLSFPDVLVNVSRFAKVKVRSLGLDGKPFEIEADDLLGVAFQHEIDHLNGISLADKVSFLRKKMIIRELLKKKIAQNE